MLVCVPLLSESPNRGLYIFECRSPSRLCLHTLCDRVRKISGLHMRTRKACAVFRNILVAVCVSFSNSLVTLTSCYLRTTRCALRTVSHHIGTFSATSSRRQTLQSDDALKHSVWLLNPRLRVRLSRRHEVQRAVFLQRRFDASEKKDRVVRM